MKSPKQLLFAKLLCQTLLLTIMATPTYAAKYKPINEIPGQVPATAEEQEIWSVGKAHVEKVRGSGEVVNDPEMEAYLEGVVAKLLGSMVDTIGLEVDVLVFKDTTVNAWVYPDGTVAVQTGMLAAMENEAQLAAILGHEISHFLNRHAFIQIKSKQKQSVIGKGLGLLATAAVAAKTGAINTNLMGAGQVWTELVTSGYSRKLETAADRQGLQLLVAAGYPAQEALPAFEQLRMKEDNEASLSKMWSSHPDIDSRLKNLKKQIKKMDTPATTEQLAPAEFKKAVSTAILVNSQLRLQRRQFEAALADLKQFTNAKPDEPFGYYLLGEALRQQNPESNYEQRIAAYQQALAIDPKYTNAYRELGMAYRQQGDNTQAIEAFKAYTCCEPMPIDAPIVQWYLDQLQTSEGTQGAAQ